MLLLGEFQGRTPNSELQEFGVRPWNSPCVIWGLWTRGISNGRKIVSAVSVEKTLMGRREEREPIEIVLVVHFHAFGKTCGRVTRGDQADQHAIHVHLIAIGRSPTANPPAVGEAGIDGRIEREDVAREAILDRGWSSQVNRSDDIQPLALH